jgi:hypothetical protein
MRPCKDISTFALYVSNCRRPRDHEEIFALLPYLFQTGKKHLNVKKDLHFGFIYLKLEMTTRPWKEICTFAKYISNWKGPWDNENIFTRCDKVVPGLGATNLLLLLLLLLLLPVSEFWSFYT